MDDKHYLFVGGLHRSGTSLLHEILKSHRDVSGFENTGVHEDEGQHLQTVYPPAKEFGGPGRFGFDKRSFMDESHPLVSPASARRLRRQWGEYWDDDKPVRIEKSPPNLVRTRFLQALFPGSRFIVILRHPVAVAYATQKWSKTSIPSLIEHNLRCYERFKADLPFLESVYVLRYEEFVLDPENHARKLLDWIGLDPIVFDRAVRADINLKYFDAWRSDQLDVRKRLAYGVAGLWRRFEGRANAFGYSIKRPAELLPLQWSGSRGGAYSEAALTGTDA